MIKGHKKKKSLGGLLFQHSSSSPNLKSFLNDDTNSNVSGSSSGEPPSPMSTSMTNDSASKSVDDSNGNGGHLLKVTSFHGSGSIGSISTPSSPTATNNNLTTNVILNSSSGSIDNTSLQSPPTSNTPSPIMGKKKPSRLVQAFKRVKNNNKLKKEIEELSNKTGLNQQYTHSNFPFNVIDDIDNVNGNGGSTGSSNHQHTPNHSRSNSTKKQQRKSRFIEPVSKSTEDYTDIPRIIKLSVEYLFEKCLKTPGLFRESANALELQRLSQVFEKGEDIDLSEYPDPHCIGGLLKLYFRERPIPIFPYDLHKLIYSVLNEEESNHKIKLLLETGLSKGQFLILRYLFELLNAVSNNNQYNFMNYQNLAICFAPSLIQSYDPSCYDVIERLIEQYESIFSVSVVVVVLADQQNIINTSSENITVTLLSHEDNGNGNTVGNTNENVRKSPNLSSSRNSLNRNSVSPKLSSHNSSNNNRKSINLTSDSIFITNEVPSIEPSQNTTFIKPTRKTSSAHYLQRINTSRRPSSWNNTIKKPQNHSNYHNQQSQQSHPQTPPSQQQGKRLNSVNGLESYGNKDVNIIYNSLKEESNSIKKSSLNKQMTIVNSNNNNGITSTTTIENNSECTSEEDEELQISKPISRSPSISSLSNELNGKQTVTPTTTTTITPTTTTTPKPSNVSISTPSTPITTTPTKTNVPISTPTNSVTTTSTNNESSVVGGTNYNRFQPANRTLSSPNVKNFSVPTVVSGARIIGKKQTPSLFSPRKQSIISKQKVTYVGSYSTSSLKSTTPPISTPTTTPVTTPSPTPNSSYTNLTPLNNSPSKGGSFGSVSKLQEKALPTKTAFVTQQSSPSLHSLVNNTSSNTATTTPSTNRLSSSFEKEQTKPISTSSSSSGSNTFIKGHSHSQSHSNISTTPSTPPPSLSSSTSSTTTSNLSNRTLNHTISTSSLISKFNQIDTSAGNSSSPNWKGGVVLNKKQDPVKKSLALFEKKTSQTQ